ncbi:MAG: hypothetical protein ABIO70_01925 [Pseudomonadota bacterium]
MAVETQHVGKAWYDASRADFVAQAAEVVVGSLASAAGEEGWSVEGEQHQAWRDSVELLQQRLRGQAGAPIATLRAALDRPDTREVRDVILNTTCAAVA